MSYAVAEENVFSKKLKITFSEAFNLSGIHVYSTDYAGTLLARITYIEGVLAGLSYDLGYGSYKTEAKTKLEGVLAQAKAAQGVNSLNLNIQFYILRLLFHPMRAECLPYSNLSPYPTSIQPPHLRQRKKRRAWVKISGLFRGCFR